MFFRGKVRTYLVVASIFLCPIGQSVAQKTSPPPVAKGNPGLFVDVTKSVGINFQQQGSPTSRKYLLETMGSGVAVFDIDNDGRLDVFFANGAAISDPTAEGTIPKKNDPKYWNRLYHQKADGNFEDVTEKAGVAGLWYSTGVAVGDYDNDGYDDLFVAGFGHNILYHNNGNGTFTNVTDEAGVSGGGWSTSAAWVDYDNDGRLDLVVARYMQWDFQDIYCGEHREGFRAYCHPDLFKPATTLLYHNEGNGKFTEVSQKVGVATPTKGLGVAINDYDHDGRIDILIANDAVPESLFHNKGNGEFEEVGMPAGVAVDGSGAAFSGMGVDFDDYNNDGWPDLIITDLANQKYAFFTNSGDGTFSYDTIATGLGAMTLLHSGWGTRFLDYDNDGWKDLLIVQSHVMDTIEKSYPHLRYRESPLLARNESGRTFLDVSSQSGEVFQQKWAARAMAIGDLNNDGKVDAVITSVNGPAWVLMNQTPTSYHWITLNLIGVKSNRGGIGAQVTVTTPAGKQYAIATTTGSYQSSSDRRLHFGLGQSSVVNAIEIHWPSGVIQKLTDVKSDQILTIKEESASGR